MLKCGKVQTGNPAILGATPMEDGVNFAVHAGIPAEKMVLCLRDPENGSEHQIELPGRNEEHIWSGFVPGLQARRGMQAGAQYLYRAHGPWKPEEGHVFNPDKAVLDPWAKRIVGNINWADGVVHPYRLDHPGNPDRDLIRDSRNSWGFMPFGEVIDANAYIEQAKRWRAENNIPEGSSYDFHDMAIMEVHIKGATKNHPLVNQGEHGTYGALTKPGFVNLIKDGITHVELMPVHSFPYIDGRGKVNYWGYMTLNYFTPNNYSFSQDPLQEFVDMVQGLRKQGIEVIMDVVFNHTAEESNFGPQLSFKGLDSRIYRRNPGDLRSYFDTTGCGNSLDFNHPMARRLVVESMEHFVKLGVTGFRFDLGVALGREGSEGRYNAQAKLFTEIMANPLLRNRIHLMGEPWDINQQDSYQLGNTPFKGWNGKYRDFIQKFALSNHGGDPAELSRFITGSPHIFNGKVNEGVNFVTAHDNHTLADLTALEMGYSEQDLANPQAFLAKLKEDPAKLKTYQSRQQFAIALLATSVGGPPLIPLGHGRGHLANGIRDQYDHDDPVTWVNWVLGENWQQGMLDFTKEVFELRRRRPELRRAEPFTGVADPETGKKDITYYTVDGREMNEQDWKQGQSFSYVISGAKTGKTGTDGKPIYNSDMVFFINGGHEPIEFTLPPVTGGVAVQSINSNHLGGAVGQPSVHEVGNKVKVGSRALVVFEGGRKRSVDVEQAHAQQAQRVERGFCPAM
jgi:glycogen operon protein